MAISVKQSVIEFKLHKKKKIQSYWSMSENVDYFDMT